MRRLVWDTGFVRAYKRAVKNQPDWRDRIEAALRRLANDPFDPELGSHKLKGKLKGAWACCVGYDLRILFAFVPGVEEMDDVLLIDIGTHDEVY